MRLRGVALAWAILTAAGCDPDDDSPGGQGEQLAAVLDQPFHREGMVDATNLVIGSDGVLRWRIFGCDFDGGGEAAWTAEGDSAVLERDAGGLDWIGDYGVLTGIERITFTPEADGYLLAVRVTFLGGDPPVEQQWTRGGICAQCGGSLGPTGTEPCEEPFADYR